MPSNCGVLDTRVTLKYHNRPRIPYANVGPVQMQQLFAVTIGLVKDGWRPIILLDLKAFPNLQQVVVSVSSVPTGVLRILLSPDSPL